MDNDQSLLFRPEAIAAAGSRLGSAIKPVDVGAGTLTAVMAAIFVATGGFLTTTKYARKETVSGVLEPLEGASRIVSPKPGIVTTVNVRDGQTVAEGQPLITINQDLITETGAPLSRLVSQSTSDQREALQAQIAARRVSSEEERQELLAKRKGLINHKNKLVSDLQLQGQRVALQEESLESFRSLNERKIVSNLQFRDREDGLIQARQMLSNIQKDNDDTLSNLAQVNAQLSRLSSDLLATEAQLDAGSAQLRQQEANNSAAKEIVLTAPKAGRVVAIQVKPGSSVINTMALATIIPDGAELHAELWAPSRAAGFVRSGDRVRLMVDAFPYQKFGIVPGQVTQVASAPTAAAELPITLDTKEAMYRINVRLDRQSITGYGKPWPFSPGMRVNADLILEKRTFLQLILDPLYASARRTAV